MKIIREYSLVLAWIVSLVATGGSLYMSEILHWTPCNLCWFQRIFMYPMVIILGIAAFRNDARIRMYTIPLAIVGGLISTYHYALQHSAFLQRHEVCKVGVPCSAKEFEMFGFITIPFLALVAFVLIVVLLFLSKKK